MCAFNLHQDQLPWMTLNWFEFSRNVTDFGGNNSHTNKDRTVLSGTEL